MEGTRVLATLFLTCHDMARTWLYIAATPTCVSWHSLGFNRGFWLCCSPVSHWGEVEEGPPSAPTGVAPHGVCPLAKADPSPPAPHPALWHPALSFARGEPQSE